MRDLKLSRRTFLRGLCGVGAVVTAARSVSVVTDDPALPEPVDHAEPHEEVWESGMSPPGHGLPERVDPDTILTTSDGSRWYMTPVEES